MGTAGAQPQTPNCLTHVAGPTATPDYPETALSRGKRGKIRVELTFTAPDRAPDLKLIEPGDKDLISSVRRFAAGLRLPCLSASMSPLALVREYNFDDGYRRPLVTLPEEERERRRLALRHCVVHKHGLQQPPYPRAALRVELLGRVVFRRTYENASDPPKVEVFHRPYAAVLGQAVQDWAAETVMPCHDGQGPLMVLETAVYSFGNDEFGFRAPTFRQFLGAAKGIEQQAVSLDTHEMDCPFEVFVSYRQPFLPNGVSEIGAQIPARRKLLDWMRNTELDVPERTADAIFADTARITIPCVKIDLKPKEKTS